MNMSRIVVNQAWYGLASMQVCSEADVTDEEILEFCNRMNPSGTQNGWVHVEREGKRAPIECSFCYGRLHFVVDC